MNPCTWGIHVFVLNGHPGVSLLSIFGHQSEFMCKAWCLNDDSSCGIPFFLLWINSTKAIQVGFSEYFDVSSNTTKQKRSDSRVNLKLDRIDVVNLGLR